MGISKSIDVINNSCLINPKILEIGSGDGAFIRKLIKKRLTLKNNITSIEYSEYGKSRIEKWVYNVYP